MNTEFQFPPRPETLAETLKVLSRESRWPSQADVIDLIEKDPTMAAYVLRRVNSPYYGVRNQIVEVDRAVTILGMKTIFNLIITASLKQTFAFLEDGEVQEIYYFILSHEIATAGFGRELALFLNNKTSEFVFSASLLHQIGRLGLLCTFPERYSFLWNRSDPAHPDELIAPTPEEERNHFDCTYIEAGTQMARDWDLPDRVRLVIQHHRDPKRIESEDEHHTASIVAAASAAAEYFRTSSEPPDDPPDDETIEPLRYVSETNGLTITTVWDYLADRAPKVKEFAQIL